MNYSPEFYEATDVRSSCFVFASAGSGKTKILVDRYVKTLFFGIDPRDILCITFTNAAVFEMENRISNILEKLYLNENGFTEEYLKNTLNINEVSKQDIEKANGLFFKFQDNLSQLKILTIHSFCQLLLQQFPLESEISPNFRILDDTEALKLIQEAKDAVLEKIPEKAVKNLSQTVSLKTLEDFVNRIYQLLPKFVDFFNHHDSLEDYQHEISELFKISPFQDFSDNQKKFIEEHFANDDLDEVYLTKSGTLRKKIPFKGILISREISEIVLENFIIQNKLKTIEKTCSFLRLVKEIISEYQILKNSQKALDFSDVLYKAKFLLTESCAKEFVTSKICSQIKAIMIDEAQDLSAIQWELINIFADDIYSDPSSQKTIFVVGDIKQSIYRFQGADCKQFSECYKKTSEIFKKSGRELKTVYLDTSYRTLPKILEAVDQVFSGEISKFFLGNDAIHYQKHKAFRNSELGHFEKIKVSDSEDPALEIAKEIAKLKTDDSLILTRSRNELSEKLMNELSNLGIKIAPPDRIKLSNNILIMDLLAVADFCLDQNNDYALCCILKSQYLFENPLNDSDLFKICSNRIFSVFENLKSYFPEKFCFFEKLLEDFNQDNLQEFFYSLTINLHTLSDQDLHILSGFLDETTKFSKNKTNSIPEFLEYFRSSDIEITSQETSKMAIRLSTIHGSKGLEAKTVFILDFSLEADKAKTKFLFADNRFFIKPSQKESFFEISQITETEYEEERRELLRLLYVAMTRARDNLFILDCDDQNRGITTGEIF